MGSCVPIDALIKLVENYLSVEKTFASQIKEDILQNSSEWISRLHSFIQKKLPSSYTNNPEQMNKWKQDASRLTFPYEYDATISHFYAKIHFPDSSQNENPLKAKGKIRKVKRKNPFSNGSISIFYNQVHLDSSGHSPKRRSAPRSPTSF